MIHNRHLSFWTPVILISGALMLLLALVISRIAHADPVVAGEWQQVATAPALDPSAVVVAWFGAISGGLSLMLMLAFQILKIVAPRTETKVDDKWRDAIGEILEAVRGGALGKTTVVVQQPPPPGAPGFARVLLLVILTGLALGALVGFAAIGGCAAAEKYTDAAGHALYKCSKQDLPSIAATAAGLGARAALAGKVDKEALYTAAKGAGLGVGTCAAGEFLRALQAQPEAQVAARGGEPGPVVEAQALLERLRGELGDVRVQLADGTVL